jgi:LmbE family N-acetylglucosaminyl deacetylase
MTEAADSAIRVLVVMAHPDDAEFGAAGTVARWAREGRHVSYAIVTDGNRGTEDPEMTPERLTKIRHAEQRAAATKLGVREVFFLGYDDGSVQPTLDLRREITRWIRRCKPDVVVAPDPSRWFTGQTYVNHPDHRATGDATLAAIMPSADTRLIFPELLQEGLEPHKVKEIYLTGPAQPDMWVDITDTFHLKIQALREHASQIGDWTDMEESLRQRAHEIARDQPFELAEAFKYIKLRD